LEPFENVDLQAELDRLRSHVDDLSLFAVDNGPPTKRRKVREEDHLLDEVVFDLYALLGSQKANDLDGLSQVAEYGAVHLFHVQ